MKLRCRVMRVFYGTSFRMKLVLSYVVILLIPFLALSIVSSVSMWRTSVDQSMRYYYESLRQAGSSLTRRIERYQDAFAYLLSSFPLVEALQNTNTTPWERFVNYRESVDPLISMIVGTNSDIAELTLYHDNPVLADREPTIRSLNRLKGLPMYADVMRHTVVWQREDANIVYYHRLMSTYDGAPAVVLRSAIPADRVFSFSLDITQAYAVFVAGEDGSEMWFESGPAFPEEVDARRLFDEYASGAPSGGRYLIIEAPVERTPWRIFLMMPRELVYAGASRPVLTTLLITALCFLLIFPLMLVLSRNLVERISHLNHLMLRVSQEEDHGPVTTPYMDEIGSLTNQFSAMVQSLRQSTQALYISKIKQQEAEMRALRAQINPHFLYNTLSLINWKSIEADVPEISETVEALSTFYRTALNQGKNESTLGEEITNITSYITIQQALHNYSFTITYDIPEALKRCQVLAFVLQPLVENAIEHGVDLVRNLRGRLRITAVRTQENHLVISVYDNGKGFTQAQLEAELSNQGRGYGLKNVNDRTRFANGDAFGLRVGSAEGEFCTCIQLVLPYIESD